MCSAKLSCTLYLATKSPTSPSGQWKSNGHAAAVLAAAHQRLSTIRVAGFGPIFEKVRITSMTSIWDHTCGGQVRLFNNIFILFALWWEGVGWYCRGYYPLLHPPPKKKWKNCVKYEERRMKGMEGSGTGRGLWRGKIKGDLLTFFQLPRRRFR